MRSKAHRIANIAPKQLLFIAPYFPAMAVIVFLLWTSHLKINQPYDGIDWSAISGEVRSVREESPASSNILVGDVILKLDGVSATQATPLYSVWKPGTIISIDLRRGESYYRTNVRLEKAPLSAVLTRIAPLVAALAFWIIGVGLLSFGPKGIRAHLFYILCLTSSCILISGAVSARGPAWGSNLFNLFLWGIGPLSVHFHLRFLEDRLSKKTLRLIPITLYAISIAGSLPFILFNASTIQGSPWNNMLYVVGRIFLITNILLTFFLLVYSYLTSPSQIIRGQIRLVALGAGISLLLVTSLSILPDALRFQTLVPYEFSFLSLIAIPLTYGYVIARYRLIKLERFFNRFASLALVISLIIALYVITLSLLAHFLSQDLQDHIVAILLLTLVLAVAFDPIRQRIQIIVDKIFYGGWYDYPQAVQEITGDLQSASSTNELGDLVSDRLKSTFRLESVFLLLREPEGSLVSRAGANDRVVQGDHDVNALCELEAITFSGIDKVFKKKLEPVHITDLVQRLINIPLSEEEQRLVNNLPASSLIVPILGREELMGLIVLGQRLGGEFFRPEDYSILGVVSRQTSVALENIQLLCELKNRATEVNRLHGELLKTRESERKWIARELHDVIIQALVGLRYQIAQIDDRQFSHLHEEIAETIQNLRSMCRELRPPSLDNLGIVPAIRSFVKDTNRRVDGSIHFKFVVDGDEDILIPEDISICIYRTLQEAITNILKHAAASQGEVVLRLLNDKVILVVCDNGVGFDVPRRLGQLLDDDRFGLVGLRERLEILNGSLEIKSTQGSGTSICARIPLPGIDNCESKKIINE